MTRLLLILALIALASPAAAVDGQLAARAPVKSDHVVVPPPADPELMRQGGDTVDDATVIDAMPYDDVGTTAGYSDDYNWACPFDSPGSPDVVYTITPVGDTLIDVDLCGSSYDTKLYFCDAELSLLDCSDDYYFDDECGEYTSALFGVPVSGGMQYFIIVDGYGGDYGDYILSVSESAPCIIECPPGGFPEGEPPLQDDQINAFNDGCGSDNPDGFQDLAGDETGSLVLCGTSGWYLYQGSNFRDTDWFVVTFGPDGIIELTGDAEQSLLVYELGPQDCADVAVVQWISVGPCFPVSMTVTGEPFATVWLWTGAPEFVSPDGTTPYEFDYLLMIDGLHAVATESSTWSQVKGLYR